MPSDILHYNALIATARGELDNAHRAAISAEAGDLRRGLQMSLNAMAEAATMPEADEEPVAGEVPAASPELLASVRAMVEKAMADLEEGSLAGMASRIEDARKELGA